MAENNNERLDFISYEGSIDAKIAVLRPKYLYRYY